MKTLVKRLPVFAFVLAAFAAFAFNTPDITNPNPPVKLWTPDSSAPHNYREITGEEEGTHFLCDEAGPECSVMFQNDDPASGIKTNVVTGTYLAIP
ncbi:hypothetical protein SYJ56_25105 [Algoriphagus sp. D3-2-R+10]|uniref:hypothetical protein n=1 Tax=Algoriphagus aurantiacus TaxID=3103948 RepID=UPI002B3992D3|nr:hypothetical protein [Algoriphagus sp. D3-2-R+10]MEB2778612.1 hypothetical protein [Algoriphagus sp. D3-2-R+10]